jgi:hypothetical protein
LTVLLLVICDRSLFAILTLDFRVLRNIAISICSAHGGPVALQGLQSARSIFTLHHSMGVRLASSKHRSEQTIPRFRGDTVVSPRKLVMVEVMFQQGSWEDCRIIMGAIVHRQIPGVSDESAGQNSASRGQVDNAEGEPNLPEETISMRT